MKKLEIKPTIINHTIDNINKEIDDQAMDKAAAFLPRVLRPLAPHQCLYVNVIRAKRRQTNLDRSSFIGLYSM